MGVLRAASRGGSWTSSAFLCLRPMIRDAIFVLALNRNLTITTKQDSNGFEDTLMATNVEILKSLTCI